jgi:hypothetical protein
MLPPEDRDPPLEREAPEEPREAPELLPEDALDPEETLAPDEDPDREDETRAGLPTPRLRPILPRKEPDLEAPESPPALARVMLGEGG